MIEAYAFVVAEKKILLPPLFWRACCWILSLRP